MTDLKTVVSHGAVVNLGDLFVRLVGKTLDHFHSPAELEAAVEEKVGHKLAPMTIDPERNRVEAELVIRQGWETLKRF